MPTRDTPFAPGTPCWVDLATSDPARSTEFYTSVFGWTFTDAGEEFGNYVNFSSDGHLVAGMMRNPPESGAPDGWTTYLSTDNIDETVSVAAEAGADIMFHPLRVETLGTMAVVIDPAGAAVGLWQPGEHTGFGKYNEPGSVTWDEVHSKNFTASIDFYSTLFGWKFTPTSDTDEFRYFTAEIDDEPVAGIMDSKAILPAEVPSHWEVYFTVADVDATLVSLTEHGGTIVRPAQDTPFGRIAEVTDPTGAMFNLHQVIE